MVRDGEEISFGWLARSHDGTVVIAGGRYAGEPWPNAIPDSTPGRIGLVQCPILNPEAQIESKEMMPVWVPGRPRRPKDAEDIARLRQALSSRQP